MSELSRDEFLAHIGPMQADIAEMIRLQREANGRMGKAEVRLAILEDRSPGRVGAAAGGIGALIIAALFELLKLYEGK